MHERPAPRKDSKVRRLSCSTKQLSMFPTLFFRNVNPEILFKQEPNSSAVELEGKKSASDDVGPPFFFSSVSLVRHGNTSVTTFLFVT